MFGFIGNLYGWNLTEVSKPYKGQTVKISLMAGYEINKILLAEVIPEFEKKTNINVEVHFVPYQDVIPQHKYILESKNTDFDLLNVDNIWFPSYVGFLQSIDSLMKNNKLAMPWFDIADFVPELLNGYQWEGRTYCFPATFEFPILMVRKDLLKEAGLVDKLGNIIAPRNLDEYYEYAKRLTKDVNGDGEIDVYGTTLHGYKTGIFDEITSWYWGAGGEILDDYLKPSFNNPLMTKAVTVYQDIYKKGYASPDSVNWELGEAATAFRTGKAAMSWNWTMVATWVLDPRMSYVSDKVEFVPLFKENYQRIRYLREASNALCIPKNSDNKEAAFLFIQWLTSSEIQKKYTSKHYRIHPSRKSVIFSEEYANKIPYAHIQRDVIRNHAIRLCPKINEYPDIDQIAAMHFQQIMIGETSVELGLKKAVEAVDELLTIKNYYGRNKKYSSFLSGRYK